DVFDRGVEEVRKFLTKSSKEGGFLFLGGDSRICPTLWSLDVASYVWAFRLRSMPNKAHSEN
ncbi:MAG: hypothetical protein ACKVTZ_17740, partial [Bacteroidia bacterium]